MKRWAIITVALYAAVLLLLTVPVAVACFSWGHNPSSFEKILSGAQEWGYWIWIGGSLLAQILLLLVPVALAERRPRARRHLMAPVITAAFLFAIMSVSVVTALGCGIWGDNGLGIYEIFGNTSGHAFVALALYIVITWTIWTMVFRRFADMTNPEALTPRLIRWLLRGSILELLIAVPSHVISRNRHDCCAPIGTFWGIATGVTVMLLAFGPGVFYLFVERMQRLQPKQTKASL